MEGKKMDSDTTAYFKEENPTRNTTKSLPVRKSA
jgi:hypothetical protein